jgi:hypothetical protein
MKTEYSLEVIRQLEATAQGAGELRPFRRSRYEPGDIIEAELTGVAPANRARGRLEIRRFAGGGFAGQVYQAELKELTVDGGSVSGLNDGPIAGLKVGGLYAVKILIPPSRFSVLFRNLTYWLAYQGPFSSQVSPAASRVGVLWQKLIRRGAGVAFGREDAVADTHATFFHEEMKSFAEVNEWVPGRTWLYEIDDNLFERKKFDIENPDGQLEKTASKEYLGKRLFMARVVQLFHDMGAPELARQYEWWTSKSQPNALRRLDADDGPMDGLCAIDFRAGLALLPFVPMSPGDFKLIGDGFNRGNAVQFDRGNLDKLEAYINAHAENFEDLRPALEELKEVEKAYRASLPDITHHGTGVFLNDELRPKIKAGLVEGYRCARLVDDNRAEKLRTSGLAFTLFYLIGAIPILGGFLRRLWGHARYRAHLGAMLTSFAHLSATIRTRVAERLIGWHRAGRVSGTRALFLSRNCSVFLIQRFTIGFLPAKWHRCLAEPSYFWGLIRDGVCYAWSFLWKNEVREKWLTDQIDVAFKEGMLTADEKKEALGYVSDPFIKKYLVCVGVHICTLPITQLVSLAVAIWFMVVYGKTWGESIGIFTGIMILFQAIPISPGSIVRGLFVVGLMIYERNWRSYWVAALISFWKYIGYLGFPIQMTKTFPILARLTAGRWAASIVGIVPVFGEKGALLEHWVFDLFFNVPATLSRRWHEKKTKGQSQAAAHNDGAGAVSCTVGGQEDCSCGSDSAENAADGSGPDGQAPAQDSDGNRTSEDEKKPCKCNC